MEWLNDLAAASEASGFGRWARGSALTYPAANLVHLLGLVMLVGGIGIVDLRLAGAFRRLPAAALSRALTPVALAGLALMVLSGGVMFASDAKALAASPVFRWKLGLIAAALTNALLFRMVLARGGLGDHAIAPAARLSAILSLLLWLAAATMGRLIAYS